MDFPIPFNNPYKANGDYVAFIELCKLQIIVIFAAYFFGLSDISLSVL